MALDRTKSTEKLLRSTVVGGGIHNRGGWRFHRYHIHKWSPRRRFPCPDTAPDDAERAVAEHEAWIERIQSPDYQNGRTNGARHSAGAANGVVHDTVASYRGESDRPRSLHEAVRDFEELRFYKEKKPGARKNYDRAFAYFVQRPIRLGDDPEENFQRIYKSLLDRCRADDLSHNVRVKYLNSYSVLFARFLIPLGVVSRDPVEEMGREKRKQKTKNLRFTLEEIDAIVAQLFEQESSPDYAIAIRVLARSALRPAELLEIRRPDIGVGLRVVCKGSLEEVRDLDLSIRERMIESEEVGIRNIPIDMIPGLREDIDALLTVKLPPGTRRRQGPEYLVRWRELDKLRAAFNHARARVAIDSVRNPSPALKTKCENAYAMLRSGKIPYKEFIAIVSDDIRAASGVSLGDGRTLYTLRASALWWWENVLGWQEPERLDAAGHSRAVNRKNYRNTVTAEELAARISRSLAANIPAEKS